MLTQEIKNEITKRLKRSNPRIFDDKVIPHIIQIVDDIKNERVRPSDYFIPGMVTFEDYLYQLNLIKFVL